MIKLLKWKTLEVIVAEKISQIFSEYTHFEPLGALKTYLNVYVSIFLNVFSTFLQFSDFLKCLFDVQVVPLPLKYALWCFFCLIRHHIFFVLFVGKNHCWIFFGVWKATIVESMCRAGIVVSFHKVSFLWTTRFVEGLKAFLSSIWSSNRAESLQQRDEIKMVFLDRWGGPKKWIRKIRPLSFWILLISYSSHHTNLARNSEFWL